MLKVLKRNKTVELFQKSKIERAVKLAFISCNEEFDKNVTDCIESNYDLDSNNIINVESIQDTIENCLMSTHKNVAKAYIIYRYEHKLLRDSKNKLVKQIKKKLTAEDVQNQNANVDEFSFGGRMGEATRVVTKEYALENCMSKKSRKNHLNNEIYIHDLDTFAIGEHNCLTYPLDESLSQGVKTRQTDIRPAKSISTAFQLIAVFFQIQSLQQFGGVSCSHLDWTMVPYVRMSFFKHFTEQYIFQKAKDEGINLAELNYPDREKYKSGKRKEFKEKYGINDEEFRIGDFAMKCVNFHIDDDKIKKINEDWYNFALTATKEELSQAVEGMYHNLNSLQSRSGCQLPFTSINYGTCTLPEGRMVIRAILEGSLKGVGFHHLTPIFPCGIFQLMKGVNRKPGDPNYDLYKLALKSTSLRIYPNYVNVDWSVNEGYDKNNPRTYVSTMGCRTYNGSDINALPGVNPQMKDGRGNLCPVTIILPTLAMEADRDTDKFMKLLDKKIHEAKDMLLERFDIMCKQSPKAAKYMWENKTMFGYDEKEGPISALKHGTLVIGQIALAETLELLIGTDQTTEKGMELAKKIEGLFKTRCAEFKKQYHLNFGVYMTPAENLCYTSFKKFKAKYGDIEGVTYYIKSDGTRKEKKYFTNSIHVPVYKEMDPFEKIDIESQLTSYSNAGCITYVELPSSTKNNIEGLETIVNYAMDKDIPYFAVNVPIDECHSCGYTNEMGDICPECGGHNVQHLRRVTGYLSTTYEHFNLGKQDEVKDRVKHIKEF